jgi:hypothetical protein
LVGGLIFLQPGVLIVIPVTRFRNVSIHEYFSIYHFSPAIRANRILTPNVMVFLLALAITGPLVTLPAPPVLAAIPFGEVSRI